MKKLHISRENTMIAGVCGGIAETYNIDVSLVRVLFIVSALFSGVGIILYIALMLILPKGDNVEGDNNMHTENQKNRLFYRVREGQVIAGICAGLSSLLKVDVNIIRVATVLITIFSSGLPIILYIILWIILPYKDTYDAIS